MHFRVIGYNIYESGEIMNIHMLLTVESGHYSIKKSHINRNCGSAYDTWLNMGASEVLDALVDTHEVILYEIERNL